MSKEQEVLSTALYEKVLALEVKLNELESSETVFPILTLVDGVTAPSTASGFALIYVDTSDGDLKVKFGNGTTKTIVTD